MPAYNFRREFSAAVERGEKAQTIRKPRKRPTVVGDRLYLYTGQRSKACRKLGEGLVLWVEPLEIGPGWVRGGWLGGRMLSSEEILALAKADGFKGPISFFKFFRQMYGLPCDVELIRWVLVEGGDGRRTKRLEKAGGG